MDKRYKITREEAIQILSTRDAHGVLCGYTSGVTEALDMAIEALTEPINCVKCKHYYETEDDTDVHGNCRMDTAHTNLISRADAIEAVAKLNRYDVDERNRLRAYIPFHGTECNTFIETIAIYKALEALPSANAVSREEYEEVKAYMDTLVNAFIEDGEELAELVNVVRCNECKWYQGVHGVQGHAPCEWFNKQVLWNDFCSNGEPYKGGDTK